MTMHLFHPLVRQWFESRFDAPTEPQERGWPHIAADRNTLIAAPTGSGKTLAAFLVFLDRLLRQWIEGNLEEGIQVVYVSPLKALSNDIQRNLQTPLEEIRQLAQQAGLEPPPIRTAVRTGDTPASQRQAMLRRPPHILVTTPESLYLLLTSPRSRELLRGVRTVIVDEIHALARDKRGSHLALSLERLAALCERPPVRVGLSATQKPIDQIARFLVGQGGCLGQSEAPPQSNNQDTGGQAAHDTQETADASPDCQIIDVGHVRALDLALEVPPSELSAVCGLEQWAEVYQRIIELIKTHRSTLIFVNTRRMAERVSHHLTELLGEEAVASHHGSLSRPIRLSAEQRLKSGQLKAIVATASLEMGIDIGYIDLVCQIGSPRAITTFLQRVGRSGHSLSKVPKGRLFPLTRDELLECMALVRAVRRGDLDQIEIPQKPLDILAQQIVAAVACQEWGEQQLYELFRRAWVYRNLTRSEFDEVVEILSEGIVPTSRRGAYLHRDRIGGRLRARRSARLAAITSGGAIPEQAEYRVVIEDERTLVGTVDEDFAIESQSGDVFLLGNTSWRVRWVRGGEVVVNDAGGAPPTIPFWFGEAPGRTIELSHEISRLRSDIARHVADGQTSLESSESPAQCKEQDTGGQAARGTRGQSQEQDTGGQAARGTRGQSQEQDKGGQAAHGTPEATKPFSVDPPTPPTWLQQECGADPWAADQALRYVEAQVAAIGLVPTHERIVFERFFDESGGMQLVIHAPLGARINRAWGLALRKRFCRSFDFELQAVADDNGMVLSLGPQHSFPIPKLFNMLRTDNGRHLLEQALLAAPMFQVRWRWNVTRALAVLRHQNGKKVPPYLQRFRSDDLLAATFPETVGCLENHSGDIQIPDHPLVRQTMIDCLHEAMDLDRWLGVLGDVETGRVELVARDTREPSPFSHQLLNANPYAFLDGAPLEERRTRAVLTRRGTAAEDFADLTSLDPDAIGQVCAQAWPLVRDADEMHDALMSMAVVLDEEAQPWQEWLDELVAEGRATKVHLESSRASPQSTDQRSAARQSFWIAAERWPMIESVYDGATARPPVHLPEVLQVQCSRSDGWIGLVRGRITHSGPVTAGQLAERLGLDVDHVNSALEALEGQGIVMRGQFTDAVGETAHDDDVETTQWCERRLLARIHRLTLSGLRQRIQPVEPHDYLRFLMRHHHLDAHQPWEGTVGVREALLLLQGLQAPAGAWEKYLLGARVGDYDRQWLDQLFLGGELVWGRLKGPRRDESQGTSMAALTRSAPISILQREDLAWLLPPDHSHFRDQHHHLAPGDKAQHKNTRGKRSGGNGDSPPLEKLLRANAAQVLQVLTQRGALFFQELQSLTSMLPAHLEEALRELAALGLITSDAFAAVRTIVEGRRKTRGRRRGRSLGYGVPMGRWSRFPGTMAATDTPLGKSEDQDTGGQAAHGTQGQSAEIEKHQQRLERWCWQLLRRWGVVFRDLLARESAAPPWYELVRMFRRLELRGEIRGGRFVSGVGGEQFASPSAVAQLRQARDEKPSGQWVVISAADPLNLEGIITRGPRIAATHKNALVLRDGRCIAAKEASHVEFFVPLEPVVAAEMRRALYLGRRSASPPPPHLGSRKRRWGDVEAAATRPNL